MGVLPHTNLGFPPRQENSLASIPTKRKRTQKNGAKKIRRNAFRVVTKIDELEGIDVGYSSASKTSSPFKNVFHDFILKEQSRTSADSRDSGMGIK
jgi:hypothetical protein